MSKNDKKNLGEKKEASESRPKKDGKRVRWPGLLISAALIALAASFMALIYKTKMLPGKYNAALAAALLLLIAVIFLLVKDAKKRGSFWTGTVIALATAALLGFGVSAGRQAMSVITSVTTPSGEKAEVSVLVAADDPAQQLTDLNGRTFGILSALDRDSVNSALTEISSQMGGQLLVAEYPGLTQLADSLFGGQTGAIVISSAYLDLFEEMEGYEDVPSRLREISMVSVEVSAPAPTAPPADAQDDTPEQEQTPEGVFTVYLSGLDIWGGVTARSRSDVNIIATVNTNTHQVLLVSTPRDYFVPLSISDGAKDKLTHAGIYGVNVSMDTLGMLYDINIDYYFKVNFRGFSNIIDSLGGITVYSEYSFGSGENAFPKGENYLNGSRALAFARDRYSFASGDRQRGKNQMAVIKGVIDKALSPEILKSYSQVLQSIEGNFETSVPYDLIAELVREQLEDGGGWNVVTYSVDGSNDTQVTFSQGYRAYVMQPDESTVDTAKDLMQRVRNGETVEAP